MRNLLRSAAWWATAAMLPLLLWAVLLIAGLLAYLPVTP
jgi:hypothetical protein